MRDRTIKKILIALCVCESLVGLAEIGLALAYLFGASAMIESPKGQAAAMTVIYAFFLAALLWSLAMIIRAYKNNVNIPKINLISVLAVASVLAAFMLIQIISGLITRLDESYFVLSLSWNIPRLLLNAATITFFLLYIYKNKRKE